MINLREKIQLILFCICAELLLSLQLLNFWATIELSLELSLGWFLMVLNLLVCQLVWDGVVLCAVVQLCSCWGASWKGVFTAEAKWESGRAASSLWSGTQPHQPPTQPTHSNALTLSLTIQKWKGTILRSSRFRNRQPYFQPLHYTQKALKQLKLHY